VGKPIVNSTLNACREYLHIVQDRAVFAVIADLGRKPDRRHISAAALEVHVRTVARSVHTECPAFIGYTDLDAIAPGPTTTMAALELCLANLWIDARDGYVIADNELIEQLSGGPSRLWFRRTASQLSRATLRALRKVWKALNEERFIPF
jgi:hypothetical protein